MVLIAGSIAYQPGWGVLPLVKHVFGTSSKVPAEVSTADYLDAKAPSSSLFTTRVVAKPSAGQSSYQVVSSNPSSISSPTYSSTTSPTTSATTPSTPTVTPTYTSSSGSSTATNPGNSTYGHGQKISHP